ncbi:anti-sigma factor [Paracoccus fistulariae]|uniref:Anti-sigma factor n=1 Tax=Paracoccus fistulariae TaxID=658446 RepID=A0ABY7SJ46_9RHOB|nr:anti-sigma factor [Paracoccus fistulariae]MDB6180859.1 anti-sigma factor [Paracoccus fistulariae]WCR06924.1 anti-sigma factor [Paracoccus fistulariae]
MADPRDIASAGEYVLGTMPLAERQAFAQRLREDEDLAQEVARWQSHFAPLDDEIDPVTPPPQVWNDLQKRLFDEAPKPAGVSPFWRWLGLGGSLAAAALAAVIWLSPEPPGSDGLWVSDMVSEDGSVRLAALYDEDSGEMRVSVGGKAPAEGRDWELWLIQGDRDPISLGVMPHQGNAAMPIPEELRLLIADATLAITDEPAGGSPQGVATGPVVAAAPLRRI